MLFRSRSIISLVAKCLDLEVNYNNLTHVSVGELFLSKVEMWAISLSYIHSIVQEDKNSQRYINKCNSLLDKNKTFKDILFRVFSPIQSKLMFFFLFLIQTDCFNYIKILLRLNSTHLYVCGTYAFSPVCAYIVSRASSSLLIKIGRASCRERV